jgi:hypothetical protein
LSDRTDGPIDDIVGGTARPFVDQPVTDVAAADRAAGAARRAWHLDPPRRLRVGMNAIYTAGDAVLRVGTPTVDATASIGLAEVLLEHGLHVPRPVRREVLAVDELQVTCWERIKAVDAPCDWHAVGAIVRRLHEIAPTEVPAAYPAPSPACFPWWNFDALLAATRDSIAAAPLEGLERAIARRRDWSRFGAGAGDDDAPATVLCHGDVHPGNVVMSAQGPVLLDWDLLCQAPPGWDHAPMMTWGERWGGTGQEYPRFADGYGRSFRGDGWAEAFAELRLVAATLMRVRAGRSDPAAAEEAVRRLRYWAGEPAAPPWRAQ